MIRVGLCTMSLLVVAAIMHAQAAKTEQQIRELEQNYNAAYAANDLDTYFSYLAADFEQWLPSGRSDKASYQTSWTRFIKGGGRVLSAEISDLKVNLSPSGEAAVASYLLHVRTQSARGTSDERYQETDVWFKRDGAWKLVYLHYSPAPERKQP